MLHEILLSLSGHPSPLFDASSANASSLARDESLLSPSEIELLAGVDHLSRLHRDLRSHLDVIIKTNKSAICKAVGASILHEQLARFQNKIINVEKSILTQDSAIVGAYNIVPLAGIVGEFSEWTRILEWLWNLACFISPPGKSTGTKQCSGPSLINKLKRETQTGFPDVEEAALQLLKMAEDAWLRQLASWILYGLLPGHGAPDFFIFPNVDSQGEQAGFTVAAQFLTYFITPETSLSIQFIGQILNQLRARNVDKSVKSPAMELLPSHQNILSTLRPPLTATAVTDAVSSIRLSLSQNVLQKLLPTEDVIQLLRVLREYFLLKSGEFAIALIEGAEESIQARNRYSALQPQVSSKHASVVDSLRGVVIKDGEVAATLTKAWAKLASLQGDEYGEDDELELARDLVRLSLSPPSTKSKAKSKAKSQLHDDVPQDSFGYFLFPAPTTLSMNITPPFDLFMSSNDAQSYSSIHSYMLAIRRSHVRLSSMWKQTPLRREHPTPLGPPRSCTAGGQAMLKRKRARNLKRTAEMRKVWATCSAALFLLYELDDYFERQVILESWDRLLEWILTAPQDKPHDPATLATGHRLFLKSLINQLLLNDFAFTVPLRALLTSVDSLTGQMLRLETCQRNLDLEEDEGVVDELANYSKELEDCKTELDRARKRTDSACKEVIERLRKHGGGEVESPLVQPSNPQDGGFVPYADARIERLLMKLDLSRSSDGLGLDGAEDDEW